MTQTESDLWEKNNPEQFVNLSGVPARYYAKFAELLTEHADECGVAALSVAVEYRDRKTYETGTLIFTVYTHRPGKVIGPSGTIADRIRGELENFTSRQVRLNILEQDAPYTVSNRKKLFMPPKVQN